MRVAVVTLATLVLLAGSAAAQTNAELIEKAVYLDDVVGDVDGAVAIYRQILKAPTADGRAVEIAQRRLSRVAAPPATAAARRSASGARVERFRYAPFGIEFDVPPGWTATPAVSRSHGVADATLTHLATGTRIEVYLTRSIELTGRERSDPLPADMRPRWLPITEQVSALGDGMTSTETLFKAAPGESPSAAELRVLSVHRGAALVSFRELVSPSAAGDIREAWRVVLPSVILPD